jgi:hypothetical protein
MNARPSASKCPTVPLPYSVGQWDSRPGIGSSHGTAHGTISLKALAGAVLQASPVGQPVGQARDTPPEKCPTEVEGVGQSVPLSHAPVPPDTEPMEALARFERNPHGVVAWLADPVNHASRPREHSARWRACIVAEAKARVAEAEAREAQS